MGEDDMTHMVRKQIYISERQLALLRRLAAVRGVSEAEVVRQAIERETGQSSQDGADAATAAFQAFVDFARSRRALLPLGEPYQWNREEIYEERLRRFDRPSLSAG